MLHLSYKFPPALPEHNPSAHQLLGWPSKDTFNTYMLRGAFQKHLSTTGYGVFRLQKDDARLAMCKIKPRVAENYAVERWSKTKDRKVHVQKSSDLQI